MAELETSLPKEEPTVIELKTVNPLPQRPKVKRDYPKPELPAIEVPLAQYQTEPEQRIFLVPSMMTFVAATLVFVLFVGVGLYFISLAMWNSVH